MLTSDFKEFAELRNANRVRYRLVGGYALAAYGHPRYTGDRDLWVGTNPQNALRLLSALGQSGFGGLSERMEDFTHSNQVIQLGYLPGRIDLSISIDGIYFVDCHARRVTVSVDGISLRVIALEAFKTNKRAVGRLQDLPGLEALERLKTTETSLWARLVSLHICPRLVYRSSRFSWM